MLIKKSRLIVSGIRYPGGGLNNVFDYLVAYLKDTFDIVCIGFSSRDNDEAIEQEIHGCKLHVQPMVSNGFMPNPTFLNSLIDSFKPDQFLLLGPLPLNNYFLDLLTKHRQHGIKINAYPSIEGRIVNKHFLTFLTKLDRCIFYTITAHNNILDLIKEEQYPNQLPVFGVIGHGLDRDNFYPIANTAEQSRKIGREAIYEDHSITADSFIVLNINRHYYRKRIDLTIDGFEQFSRNKTDVFLHLHLGHSGKEVIQEIMDMVNAKGLQDKVIITPDLKNTTSKPESWLNNLYNSCNVGLTTAMGEGWGLGLFEHAATKAAILAPNHTSFTENWKDAALLMECADTQYVFYELSEMDIVVTEEVSSGLDQFFADPQFLENTAEKCYQKVNSDQYDWKVVAKAFVKLLS